MSHYQSLARKFRPQTFKDVCEQKAVIQTLKSAIELGRVSHAYLFCGSRGTGKTTLARIFAKALNCSNLTDDFEPCNECSSCKEITSSSSLDVIEIDGASNRGIDDIRRLNETTMYTPSSSPYRIYIIDEVHMLTKEAFNALLKTLEEPPKNVKFFFATTEPHKVLPTILSRTQRFDLRRISQEGITQKLRKILESLSIEMQEDALLALSFAAEGSLRDAESLLDQILCTDKKVIGYEDVANILGFCPKDAFFELDAAFQSRNLSVAFSLTKRLYEAGNDLTYFLDMLLDHYKKLLQIKLGASEFYSLSESEKKQYETSAKQYTTSQCLYILEYLMKWIQTLSQHEMKPAYVEMILLHLLQSSKHMFVDELVERLERLQAGTLPVSHETQASEVSFATQTPKEPEIQARKELSQEPKVEEPHAPSEMHEPQLAQQEQAPQALEPIDEEVKKDPLQEQVYETLLRFASVELNGILIKKG